MLIHSFLKPKKNRTRRSWFAWFRAEAVFVLKAPGSLTKARDYAYVGQVTKCNVEIENDEVHLPKTSGDI